MNFLKNFFCIFYSKLLNDWLGVCGFTSLIIFSYIGSPESLQRTIHKKIPEALKNYTLTYVDLTTLQLFLFIFAVILGLLPTFGFRYIQKQDKALIKKCQTENSELKNYLNNRELDTYSIFSSYLKTIFDDLKMTAEERVSLYKLDLDKFTCIGRYSDNEIYREKTHRLYPKNQGCIGQAWRTGAHEISNSPSFAEDEEGWYKYHCQTYDFSRSELLNIKMKSSSFQGIRLKDSQNDETIAVIVFESILKDGLKFGRITKYFNTHSKKALVGLVESLSAHIPTLEKAMEEGF